MRILRSLARLGYLSIILLMGCALDQYSHKTPHYLGFVMQRFTDSATGLPVAAWLPIQSKSRVVRIYIEGDGRAWQRAHRPSHDPTPINRLVHRLMSTDASGVDIAYLAQPCQYLMNRVCSPDVWTFLRYSSPVISSLNPVIHHPIQE